MHKVVSSVSTLIEIIDDYGAADLEMLQLHNNCWQEHLGSFFGVNRNDIFWS